VKVGKRNLVIFMEVDEFFLRALKRGRRFFSLSIGNPSHYF
jgi:hypothetical protein